MLSKVEGRGVKDILSAMTARDKIAKDITPFVGTFDHAEMTTDEFVAYACDKLEIKVEKGQEQAALTGFLAAKNAIEHCRFRARLREIRRSARKNAQESIRGKTMAQFQQAVNIYNPIGFPGDLAFDGPMRAAPFNLVSTPNPNVIGYAFTQTGYANPDPVYNVPNASTLASPVAGTARAGGAGVVAGILVNSKEQALYGTSALNPLGPSISLPDNTIGSLLTMGYVFVNLPRPRKSGRSRDLRHEHRRNLEFYRPDIEFHGIDRPRRPRQLRT